MFTGDLQNMSPEELYEFIPLLSSLSAKDGVYSVLGNHDYSDYIKADDVVKVANEREIISREREFGWTLLLNENKTVKRGNDSIIVAGVRTTAVAVSLSVQTLRSDGRSRQFKLCAYACSRSASVAQGNPARQQGAAYLSGSHSRHAVQRLRHVAGQTDV